MYVDCCRSCADWPQYERQVNYQETTDVQNWGQGQEVREEEGEEEEEEEGGERGGGGRGGLS